MFMKSIEELKENTIGVTRRCVVLAEGFLFSLVTSLRVLLRYFHGNCLEFSVFINTMLTPRQGRKIAYEHVCTLQCKSNISVIIWCKVFLAYLSRGNVKYLLNT